MRIKVRAEFQLEIGDKVTAQEAAMEAAKEWAEYLDNAAGDVTTPNILDVSRGKMAFIIEKG